MDRYKEIAKKMGIEIAQIKRFARVEKWFGMSTVN